MDAAKKQIEKLILDFYLKGHELSDGELYRNILHPDWKMFWFSKHGHVEYTDKETYISWYKPENSNERLKWHAEILHLDIEENLAIAKVRIYNQDFGSINYFSLMKEKGEWQIVGKISKSLDKR